MIRKILRQVKFLFICFNMIKQIIHFFRISHNPYQISLSLLMKVFFQRQCTSFKDNFKNTFHHFPQSRTKYFEQVKEI